MNKALAELEELKILLNKPSRLDIVVGALNEATVIINELEKPYPVLDTKCDGWRPAPISRNTDGTAAPSGMSTAEGERNQICGAYTVFIRSLPLKYKLIVAELQIVAASYFGKNTLIFDCCESYALILAAFLAFIRDERSFMANNAPRDGLKDTITSYGEQMNANASQIEMMAGYTKGYLTVTY